MTESEQFNEIMTEIRIIGDILRDARRELAAIDDGALTTHASICVSYGMNGVDTAATLCRHLFAKVNQLRNRGVPDNVCG